MKVPQVDDYVRRKDLESVGRLVKIRDAGTVFAVGFVEFSAITVWVKLSELVVVDLQEKERT